ncbi:MAG: DUF1569 domain-containing protein [Taibaiella sp.]|nr:DUF1569 domain-containing protein [Taibaiella sp.]
MRSVINKANRDELISRINTLNEHSKAQWGKMNVWQMLKHCTLCEEMYLGNKKYKRTFLGYLFGLIALKGMLKDERPIKRNAPTSPNFIVTETTGDVLAEKTKWISLIESYADFSDDNFEHWFFGKMTTEQVGYFAYKHTDHHLRQFGA